MRIDRKALDLLRARQCLTIKCLSKKAGVSTATLCAPNNRELTPTTIGRIAKALDVDVGEIIVKED